MNERSLFLSSLIRDIPDFPKSGILFKDITPLLKSPAGFTEAVKLLSEPYLNMNITAVLGIESRGFIFGAPVAALLGCGFVPIRKPGKLPHVTLSEEYDLEYGTDKLEMHVDAIDGNDRVVIIDDLLATGGTASAVLRMARSRGADVCGASFVIELCALKGREKLKELPIESLIRYQ